MAVFSTSKKGRIGLNWTVSHGNTRALLLRLFTLSQIISYFRKTKEVFVLRQICFWETCVRAFNCWWLMLHCRNTTKGTCADFLTVRMRKSFSHGWIWQCNQSLSGNKGRSSFMYNMYVLGKKFFCYIDYIFNPLICSYKLISREFKCRASCCSNWGQSNKRSCENKIKCHLEWINLVDPGYMS